MTEIPEYLLARSRERRAAIGGGGADAGDTGAETSPAAPAAEVAAAAPAPAAPAEVAPAEPAPPEPVAPFVEAAERRKKMPYWVTPLMLVLPIWAIYYVGTLERPPTTVTGLLGEGAEVYANCAGCHGGGGGGGVGPQLNDGEVLLTFPSLGDHISWVVNGSPEVIGTPYGDPARPGGQRSSVGGMAGWAGTLTSEELVAVVYYERVTHGGLEPEAAASELELLEAYLDTGVEFQGGEEPREITAALGELAPGGGEGEEAAG